MAHDLQLAGLSDRTQDASLRAVPSVNWADPHAVALEMVRWLVVLWAGLTYVLQARRSEQPAGPATSPGCPACGGILVRVGFVSAPVPVLVYMI